MYLVDESHHDDASTDENIKLASYLVDNKNVRLIGVEGYDGGRPWDNGENKYEDGFSEGKLIEPIGNYPRFANALSLNKKAMVVGVDSEGMCVKVEYEHYKDDGRHWLHALRSTHFMNTLFEIRSFLKIEDDMLLNCGAKHNDDIENLINGKKAPAHWLSYNIFRLRQPSHPLGPF